MFLFRVAHAMRIFASLCTAALVSWTVQAPGAQETLPTRAAALAGIAPETAAEAMERHSRVAQRRSGVEIVCHRGAWLFAQENTLEAYRATFELGADGNEIDIRVTRDGVLVCFHDDMLD